MLDPTVVPGAFGAALWLYLPAFVANGAPVVVAKLPRFPFRRPVWEAALGKNKTWAGFAGGVGAGVVAGLIQYVAFDWWPYGVHTWVLWSAAIALGALVGDVVKSYCKRKIGIPPGGAWPVVDGIDYVLGAMLFGLPLFVPTWPVALALLVSGPILSLLANVFSYSVGWKKVWY